MSLTRRELLKTSTRLLVLTPAAAAFLERSSTASADTVPDQYKMADHYWAMSIDIGKCIGCGNCVRACAAENGVPRGYFRTWVERYSVPPWPAEHPDVDSPDGGYSGFPERKRENAKSSACPNSATNAHIRRACRSVPSARRSKRRTAWCWWTKPIASGAAIACRPALTAAAISIRPARRSISARSVITGSARDSPRPAPKPVPPARARWLT